MTHAVLESGARLGISAEQREAWIKQNGELDTAGIPDLFRSFAERLKQAGLEAAVVRVNPSAVAVTPTVGLLFRKPNELGEVDESKPEDGKRYRGVFVTPEKEGFGVYKMGSNGGLWYVRHDKAEGEDPKPSLEARIRSAMGQSEESAVYGSVLPFKWEEVLSETGPDIYPYERIDKA